MLTVTRVIEEFSRTRLDGELKPHIGGVTTSLSVGSTVLVLQAVERECGTIKESVRELHNKEVTYRIGMSQESCPHRGGCDDAWVG